jgi:hypothetical protein
MMRSHLAVLTSLLALPIALLPAVGTRPPAAAAGAH